MATGKKQNWVNMCKRREPGGSGVARKVLELMGALEGPWPLGRGQNWVNICKREECGGSGVAQKLLGSIGGAGGAMATGKGAKLGKYV